MNECKAVIWDMDGVIADTAPYHFAAWQGLASKLGRAFAEDDFRHTFGLRNDDIVRYIMGQDISPDEIWALSARKEASFRAKIREGITPLPGVVPLLEGLSQAGFKMAIASSAPMENIALIAERLNIGRHFKAIVSEKDVTVGKPDPQVFLIASQRLGLPPRCCLVIEDAVAGVRAARAADMRCLAVTNSHPRESLAEADLVVDSLEEVDAAAIEALIGDSGRP